MIKTIIIILTLLISIVANDSNAQKAEKIEALSIGDSFRINSANLKEKRRINVYMPQAYSAQPNVKLPVIYMPDGGINEDFLHIAGLIQIGALNWTMRPFILVGIENTDRKRDLTGPTSNPEDKKIGKRIGGSNAYRKFIRQELMPIINQRYRTTGETAIIGESLAGLFVVETFLNEPDLFDSYIAIDPSLWWNNQHLVKTAKSTIEKTNKTPRNLHLAASSQQGIIEPTKKLALILRNEEKLDVSFKEYPHETHLSIYHPAALDALRLLFKRNN